MLEALHSGRIVPISHNTYIRIRVEGVFYAANAETHKKIARYPHVDRRGTFNYLHRIKIKLIYIAMCLY